MGLSNKEIFLELWNKTSRSKPEDYRLLLATKDYKTIKKEIERKLKKNSMSFKEVYNIEIQCFEMLRENLFSPHCTE